MPLEKVNHEILFLKLNLPIAVRIVERPLKERKKYRPKTHSYYYKNSLVFEVPLLTK